MNRFYYPAIPIFEAVKEQANQKEMDKNQIPIFFQFKSPPSAPMAFPLPRN